MERDVMGVRGIAGQVVVGRLGGLAFTASASSAQLMSAPIFGFPGVAFLHDGRTRVATLFAAGQVEFMPTRP